MFFKENLAFKLAKCGKGCTAVFAVGDAKSPEFFFDPANGFFFKTGHCFFAVFCSASFPRRLKALVFIFSTSAFLILKYDIFFFFWLRSGLSFAGLCEALATLLPCWIDTKGFFLAGA
ncbi:MAG: hypothetical protein LWX00_05980 [Spirochaetia bacterium]|nr:hypothetical protein [Spirochaetia bacterium]